MQHKTRIEKLEMRVSPTDVFDQYDGVVFKVMRRHRETGRPIFAGEIVRDLSDELDEKGNVMPAIKPLSAYRTPKNEA